MSMPAWLKRNLPPPFNGPFYSVFGFDRTALLSNVKQLRRIFRLAKAVHPGLPVQTGHRSRIKQ